MKTLALLLLASLAGFAFARMSFPGKKSLFNLVIALMVVPTVVMVVPLFVSMVSWKLVNTYQGVILIYVGLLMPFSVFLLTNFFKTARWHASCWGKTTPGSQGPIAIALIAG